MAPLYSHKLRLRLSVPPRANPKNPFSYEALNCGFSAFLRKFDYEDQLHSIKFRSLILHGAEDWITGKVHSELMAEKIPNSQLIIFAKSSHILEVDVPELYYNAIREFIFTANEHSNQTMKPNKSDNTP